MTRGERSTGETMARRGDLHRVPSLCCRSNYLADFCFRSGMGYRQRVRNLVARPIRPRLTHAPILTHQGLQTPLRF